MEGTVSTKSVYHGTVKSSADSIYNKGFIHSSKNNEWLGYGAYFFEKYNDAVWWAKLESEKPENSADFPEVITADILCTTDNFLDLDINENMDMLETEMRTVFDHLIKAGRGAPNFKNPNELTCFCCNLYRKAHSNIKILAFSFPAKVIAYNAVGFSIPVKNRQYCVSDNTLIHLKEREDVDYAI